MNPMAREKWPGQAGCRGTADDWGWGIKPRIFMGISWEYHGVVRGCTSSKFFFLIATIPRCSHSFFSHHIWPIF